MGIGTLATVDDLASAAAMFNIAEADARAIVDDVQQGVATHWKACLENRGMAAAEVELLARCFEELPRSAAELDRIIVAQQQAPRAALDAPATPRIGPRA